MSISLRIMKKPVLYAAVLALAVGLSSGTAVAQKQVKYIFAGSLRSWFENYGCEIELGSDPNQSAEQRGVEWPAYYNWMDASCAKGLWIGAANFTDAAGKTHAHSNVHVGPRVDGTNEFFPVQFQLISKYEEPKVFVDNALSIGKNHTSPDLVDPNLPCDRMILNVANTALGITMTRKIMAFSQDFHDNYFVYEITFKNTGIVDGGSTPVLNKTLTGVYFFWQYRYAPTAESRAVISNQSGWGINTMNDSRGDGLSPASTYFPGNADNDVRAQYCWHGATPTTTTTLPDNVGGPNWYGPRPAEVFSDKADTSGRLCAPQFVGVATLHADRSASDHSDDPNQPSTTGYWGSDDPMNFNNKLLDDGLNDKEYTQMMMAGHMNPRHADKVGRPAPAADPKQYLPNNDPSVGFSGSATSGGQSLMYAYGPYDLAIGDSVKIVFAEAAAGLSREKSISVGQKHKAWGLYNKAYPDGLTSQQKDDSVFTGRDSLFQTFRRAIANYNSGYAIPQSPYPPREFTLESSGNRIDLRWSLYGSGPAVRGFRIYRAVGRSDGLYTKIADLPGSVASYSDTLGLVRGVAYYYYMQCVGDPADNNGAGGTPAGVALTSNRAYSQAYDFATLQRPPGTLSDIVIVPNPYSIGAYYRQDDPYSLLFPGQKDKIAFFNVPARCRIRIFTELGELVNTIDHNNGRGDEYWNSITSSNQVVVSGVYLVVFEDLDGGKTVVKKLVVIR